MKAKWQLNSILIALLLGMAPGAAEAQQPGTRAPVPHNQVLSANPFLLLWEWTNVEYERKVSPKTTAGFSGSWISLDGGDEEYINLNALYRYYPQGAALSGFYFGGRGGVHRVSDDHDSGTALGVGFDLGYTWLLGESQNFYIGMGIGATRLFGGDLDDSSATIPNLKLVNIGFAF